MNRFLSAEELKKEFDSFHQLDLSVYEHIAPYLVKKSYPKGTILKPFDEVEKNARYVYRGKLAMLYPSPKGMDYRVTVFRKGKIASDLMSYFNQSHSPYAIKAITYCTVLELSCLAEKELLDKFPEISPLSTSINRYILDDYTTWSHLTNLPVEKGLEIMHKCFREEKNDLTMKDLAFKFKCSVSTIDRTLKRLNIKS
ncbi:cyclic nucleotide-binding domain-containing protein [Echinicola marina]|uniref:Crp/Fnr family transcriptional regulator n=1 Tax=Echinicola marina TaxID=2859768 RepID=UPI001CF6BB30|nr:cyclic nucleotide-binding domain-containing protein [Echinicola marina]UCS92301.1 cyclic nucleotide-binding domain-containing protein [Echinicola marina]